MYDDPDDDEADGDDAPMPSEFPERWSRFLPPDDVRSRLHSGREHHKQAPPGE
ncbi:YihY/virulence factor BrkB family protein, partial [Streptomyces sp. NPDC056437]